MKAEDLQMFSHVSVGTSDLERAARFYDAALGALGYKRTVDESFGKAWGLTWPEFWAQSPEDGNGASGGNGVHVAFIAADRAAVDKFHAAALAAGGTDAGAPGPRPDYYAAFVRDPDGNKIEAVHMDEVPFPER
jgi:catechol 2,3-dioxygenase-like lactoylglutathione lyase family enzyme